jgi:hypothetical protein
MALTLACEPQNDMCRILADNAIPFDRRATAKEAIEMSPDGAGILILADGYPGTPTPVDLAVLEKARLKHQRVYVEFPDALPDLVIGEIHGIEWERAVVASDVFGSVQKGRILMIHGCRYVDVASPEAHIVLGRVAGFDHAVYGLPEASHPILFEHPVGGLLVATTQLSQVQTARYAPAEAWQRIWQWILSYVTQTDHPALTWHATVRPTWRRDSILPENSETQAMRRGVQWFHNAHLFVHPDWQKEADRRVVAFPDGTGVGPEPTWPVGDGSCGMLEGASARIHPDGSQDWRYFLRNDCMGESAMALAFDHALYGSALNKTIAGNLNDFIYVHSDFAGGPRGRVDSPSYGLVRWTNADGDGVYYGDDNARSMIGTMAVSGLLGESRWNKPLLRCLLANLRTTGPQGFRSNRLTESLLQEKGWRHFWTTERTNVAPHYECWLWASFLWAYHQTGYQPFLDRPRRALETTMGAYPDGWRWTNGFQQERARMLLPLSWLVRVDDTPEHRQWLMTIAGELLQFQDDCGAIREELGPADRGSYGVPKTNEAYGTAEAPLIQENGDPLCDLLYTTNFAFVGLHEAACVTGDAALKQAVDQLAEFLCRIQVTSEARPEFDGAWFRAFDFGRWDYWASNADLGWGAWSIESGWTQGWIAAVLGLRKLNRSLWDVTQNDRIADHLGPLVAEMFPDA